MEKLHFCPGLDSFHLNIKSIAQLSMRPLEIAIKILELKSEFWTEICLAV